MDSLNRLYKLQKLIKKESSLKELCKKIFIIILIFSYSNFEKISKQNFQRI